MATGSMVLGMLGLLSLLPGYLFVLISVFVDGPGALSYSFLFWLAPVLAVVCGHRYLGQAAGTDSKGQGYARAGVTLGWISIGISTLATVVLYALVSS